MPKISVLIPVYNAEQYLSRCLESVINQTLRDIEIICVDDCSTDSSLSILREYSDKDLRIKIVSLPENQGESIARNTALSLATGEYIGAVDNDDQLDLNFYEKLYTLATETGADIVKGNTREIDYKGNVRIRKQNKQIQLFGKFHFFSQWWTAIYKTSMIHKNNIEFPAKVPLGGDMVFQSYAVLKANKIVTTDDVFYHYFRRPDSGDSVELSVEKLKSALWAHEVCTNNINTYDSTSASIVEYYANILYFIITNLVHRNSSLHCKRLCVETAIRLYNTCSYHNELDKRLSVYLTSCHEFLSNNDSGGLINFLAVNNTPIKIMTANLRTRIVKNTNEQISANNIKSIPIFFTIDDNYAPFAATTIASICHNTKFFINFYVLSDKISETTKTQIKQLAEKFNNFTIEFIEIDTLKEFGVFTGKKGSSHLSMATYSRFLIPQFKPTLNKIIYLDADIIALGDIVKLYNEDLSGHTLGAVATQSASPLMSQAQERFGKDYFNAGVLLLDLAKWREQNITEKLFQIEAEHRKQILFGDQNILNKCFVKNWQKLPTQYNVEFGLENTILRHFIGIYKPWKTNFILIGNKIQPLANFEDFWVYAKMTPFYEKLQKIYEANIEQNKLLTRLNKKNRNTSMTNHSIKPKAKQLSDNIYQIGKAQFYLPNYPKDYIQSCIVDGNNFYEFLILKCLNAYLSQDSVVFDIGANIGNHTLYWGLLTSVKQIYAFEPVPSTFAILQKNIQLNNLTDKVILNNCGLGARQTSASLIAYWADNIGEAQLQEDDAGDITIITIDDYLNSLSLPPSKVDLLKIDTEHFEYNILLGAKNTLAKYKPRIFVEIFNSDFERVNSLLGSYGYKNTKKFYNSNYLYEETIK